MLLILKKSVQNIGYCLRWVISSYVVANAMASVMIEPIITILRYGDIGLVPSMIDSYRLLTILSVFTAILGFDLIIFKSLSLLNDSKMEIKILKSKVYQLSDITNSQLELLRGLVEAMNKEEVKK